MDRLLNDIYRVYRDPECDGFGHSFLLRREEGNVLIPRMGERTTIRREYDGISEIGGLGMVFITDYHFGGASSEWIGEHFHADVLASEIEQPKLKKKGLNNLKTFPYERQSLARDLEIVPVPGHTSGGVCLLWKNDGLSYLFTGDFLYFDGRVWIPGAKTRSKISDSLNLLKTLEFDYLVGCGSDHVDIPYIGLKKKTEKVEFIDGILAGFKK
jgi:hypothetical protein